MASLTEQAREDAILEDAMVKAIREYVRGNRTETMDYSIILPRVVERVKDAVYMEWFGACPLHGGRENQEGVCECGCRW